MFPPKVRARARSAERQIPHPPPRFRIPSTPPGCRVARPPEPPLPNALPRPRPMRYLSPRLKDERPVPRRLRPVLAPLLPWRLSAPPRPLPYRPQAPAALRRDGQRAAAATFSSNFWPTNGAQASPALTLSSGTDPSLPQATAPSPRPAPKVSASAPVTTAFFLRPTTSPMLSPGLSLSKPNVCSHCNVIQAQ